VAQNKTATKTSGTRRGSSRSTKKSGATPRTKAGSKKAGAAVSAGDEEVTIDRRRKGRRDEVQPETAAIPAPQLERRQKVNRRRQIDPTTCERDYTDQEVEFMNALDDYKRKSGRMFPTCSEVLEVVRSLGYVRLSATELGSLPANDMLGASAKPMDSEWAALNGVATALGDEEFVAASETQLAY